MPTFCPFAHSSRSARDLVARSAALRGVVGLVLACIGLQSVLLPAQRTLGQAHFHLGALFAEAEHAAHAGDDALPGESVGDADDDHDEGRRHAHVGHHSHASDRIDVVYVGEDDAEASATPAHAPKRGALDLDGLWPARTFFASAEPPRTALPEKAPSFRSHVAPPLERPPRQDA